MSKEKFEPMPQGGIHSQEQYDEPIDRLDWLLCPIKDDRDETGASVRQP